MASDLPLAGAGAAPPCSLKCGGWRSTLFPGLQMMPRTSYLYPSFSGNREPVLKQFGAIWYKTASLAGRRRRAQTTLDVFEINDNNDAGMRSMLSTQVKV